MSDDDDLDAFARLFGATPQTPPEGLLAPTDAVAPVPEAPAGRPADPLGWLLSDAPDTAVAAEPAEAAQALPTRRSIAAEAARAARESAGRRNLVILSSVGGAVLVLIVVLVVALVAKNGSSGSPAALVKHGAGSPTTASTTRATPVPTVTATPTVTPTPTPTPAASQARTDSAVTPGPPTVTAALSAQPDCTSGSATTIDITYTTTNAVTLHLGSSDGSVNTNLTPAPSGTIPSVLYQCSVSGESYTLTAYSPGEGVTPATVTVTPAPIG